MLCTKLDNKDISIVTTIAPTKAAIKIAKKPVKEKLETETVPPNNNITKATPSAAPLLMPKTSGPAN